jgi:Protein of unknown function (DUF2975)
MNATLSSSKDIHRMSRIQKVSRIFRALLLAILILEVAIAITGVTKIVLLHHSQSTHLKSQIKVGNWTFNYSLSANTEFEDLILSPFGFMVTLNFFRLFTRLKDGHLFEGETVGFLEKAGKWWIALGIVQILYQFLGFVAPPHSANININDGGDAILCGLVVFFIAWVLREGQKLKEEQELTV